MPVPPSDWGTRDSPVARSKFKAGVGQNGADPATAPKRSLRLRGTTTTRYALSSARTTYQTMASSFTINLLPNRLTPNNEQLKT